jgi:riboflavin synthase
VFTGIVEELGAVVAQAGGQLVVRARTVRETAELGASVAVNGVCLTVVECLPDGLRFDVGPETLRVTALGDLSPGDPVNLERPMRLGDFVGGHLVQGHVDDVGQIAAVGRDGDTARVRIQWRGHAIAAQLVPKGSIAVDGISLTVAALDADAFEVMVIPHTLAVTTLGRAAVGRRVNLETDMIGKYVQRVLSQRGDQR